MLPVPGLGLDLWDLMALVDNLLSHRFSNGLKNRRTITLETLWRHASEWVPGSANDGERWRNDFGKEKILS